MSNEELIALVKKNPISVGCGLLSLLLVGAIYYRSGEIPAAEDLLVQKSSEAERYALNVKNGNQLKEQFEAITRWNKVIESRMVRVSQFGNNTQFFQQLRRDTGVNMVDFRQSTTAANLPKGSKTAFIPVMFSVSVQGTLPQILDFMRMLETGTHYCRVLTASMGITTRSGPLTLSLNLELLGLP